MSRTTPPSASPEQARTSPEQARPARAVGRPRRTGSAGGDPRQEILDAAARLFAERGYAATTMTEVARTVGLGQSSVYYWFSSKEELLRALVSANRESSRWPSALRRPTPLPRCTSMRCCTPTCCRCACGALDFYDLERVARSQPETFAEILDDYGRLRAALEEIVAAGMALGRLRRG